MTYILRLSQCQNLSFDTGGKRGQLDSLYPDIFLLSACFHVDALSLPSLKLTYCSPWKLMVGSDDIPFGKPYLCSGANLLFSFQGVRRFLLPQLHPFQESGGAWFLERLGRLSWLKSHRLDVAKEPMGFTWDFNCRFLNWWVFRDFERSINSYDQQKLLWSGDPVDIVGTFEVYLFYLPPWIMTDLWINCIFTYIGPVKINHSCRKLHLSHGSYGLVSFHVFYSW